MAVVRDNNKWNADLLADLTSLGSDDGVTTDVVAWAVDNNNWYYPATISATTSTWTALATGGASAWADVLAVGSTSGANDPEIDDGQSIIGNDTGAAKGGSYTVRGGDASGGWGGNLTIRSGTTGGTVGAVSTLTIAGGDITNASAVSTGDNVLIQGSDHTAGSGSNTAGSVRLRGGDSTGGNAGNVVVQGGASSNANLGGFLHLRTGENTGTSAFMWITTANNNGGGAATGNIYFDTSDVSAEPDANSGPTYATTGGATGNIIIRTGDSSVSTGEGSGDILIECGDSTNTGGGSIPGNLTLRAGSNAASGYGGGNVVIEAGDRTSTGNTFPGFGAAGSVTISGGDGGNPDAGDGGGDINLNAGDGVGGGNAEGGDINLTAGVGLGTRRAGNVVLTPGTGGTGGGVITLDYTNWPTADGTSGFVLTTNGAGTLSWSAASGGASTLQEAYEGGNTIVTDATNGALDVSGTQAISLDTSAASNFTVAGADLTLSTTTSGELDLTSAALMDMNAGANMDIDVTGTFDMLSTGAFSIDGTGASNVTADTGNLTLSTSTSGNLVLTPAGSLILDYGTWPAADGTSGQVLSTNGAGALSWTDAGGGSAWSQETAQTTDATAGVTIATPISTVTDGTQHSVEVLITAESGGSNTYFRRQVFTFYRDGGGAVQWTTEINGTEARRGLGTGVTASLSVSSNSVLVTATGQAATTINWKVQYRTTNTITNGGTVSTTGIVRELLDTRGSALTTGSAAGSGGTVDFTISAGAAYVSMQFLRVTTATGTCNDATIQFFRDTGRTDEIYDAENKDTGTGNGWVDRNTATMMGDDGSGLASNIMYGRITNNDASAATFDVETVLWGVG
jgi:hypothetical protein